MILPPVLRVFFAIDLPPETKTQISEFINQLKKKAKTHAIRWTRPENLHITLQFLPEVATDNLPKLVEYVRKELEKKSFIMELTFGTLEIFPNRYRPRVIVLEITPQQELASLAACIGKGMTACNYAIEERPFKAHLTLGRIKHPKDLNVSFLSTVPPAINKLVIDEVVLFRSEPQPEGSHYMVLETVKI